MENETFTEAHRYPIAEAENILFPLIAGLGIIANAFVILVIVVTERSRSNRTVANTFVMNLAIADILFLIMLPFHMPLWHENGFPYPDAMCDILQAMKHISYHSSILFLTGMSADRYMAIVHSLRSLQYRTQRNARIACAVLWTASILTSIPVIIFAKVKKRDIGDNTTSTHCVLEFSAYDDDDLFASYDDLTSLLDGGGGESSMNFFNESDDYFSNDYSGDTDASMQETHDPPEHSCSGGQLQDSAVLRAWQWLTFILFFVLPIIVIVFCYYKIWRATAIRKVRSQKAEGNQEQQSLQQAPNSPPKQSWNQIQSKVTVMVAVLVSAFILSWLPFQTWILLTLPPGIKVADSRQCDIMNVVVGILAWTNSLMNPILYSITSENFRKRAMTTLFFLRYGYRRTMRMSVTRTSRTGCGYKTEKTEMALQSVPHGTSPKNEQMSEVTQISPPPTPIGDGPPRPRF